MRRHALMGAPTVALLPLAGCDQSARQTIESELDDARGELSDTRTRINDLEAEMLALRQALDHRPTEAEIDVLRARLAARPESNEPLDVASIEGRLFEACAQLGTTFPTVEVETFPYCEGYLATSP